MRKTWLKKIYNRIDNGNAENRTE